jgi:ferredoxin
MSVVITRLCRDCIDMGCVRVCPVDCIVEHAPPTGSSDLPNQLFVNPEECIDCGVCEPECPWEAIAPEDDVPDIFREDIALNALTVERPGEFRVPELVERRTPSPEEIVTNRERWLTANRVDRTSRPRVQMQGEARNAERGEP